QVVGQMQGLLGINVAETLSGLGTHWSLHMPTADGGGLASALVIEVRNKSRLMDLEKNLLSRFANQGGEIPNVGRISRTTIAGQRATTLTPRTPNILVPTWCITDKQLIIGINPQAIKAVLGRQAGDKSLADLPEIAAPLAAANLVGAAGPLGLSYSDTPRAFA